MGRVRSASLLVDGVVKHLRDSLSSTTHASAAFSAPISISGAMIPSASNDTNEDFLLSSLQHVFPSVLSYKILQTIIQANAAGYVVALSYEYDDELQQPQRVFATHVDADAYRCTKKNWNDLRRTLLYARSEARFYRDFVPLFSGFETSVPTCYHASYELSGWVAEDRVTAP